MKIAGCSCEGATELHTLLVCQVLPYCLINVGVFLLLVLIDEKLGFRFVEISAQGHTFITMVVAFLLVSRVNMGLTRYNTARDAIGVMHRATRDVVLSSVVFSNTCNDEAAQEWRSEVAYRAMILLRVATAVVEYPDTLVEPWNIPELNGFELEDVKKNLFSVESENRRWAHAEHSLWEESMRVPGRLAYLLTKSLHSQKKRLKEEIQVTQENKLLASVDTFMIGYDGVRKFLTTVRTHSCPCPSCDVLVERSHWSIMPLACTFSTHTDGPDVHVSLRFHGAFFPFDGQKQHHRTLFHGLCIDLRVHWSRGRSD
jgi:Bestrophin, RFP-TM, chloride channel